MNDYFSRGDVSPVDRVSTRGVVAPVSSISFASNEGDPAQVASARANEAAEPAEASLQDEQHLASAAEYAKVHARIANIMASIRASAPAPTSTSQTDDAVSSLLPARVVIVPLPPASKDMVERAEEVARQIADRAAQSVAAQAHVKPGTVDQMMATVA
jgi:hypothetical protein